MKEILEQFRVDLMTAIYQYQQLFKEHPMPDVRYRDISKLTYIINDKSLKCYQDCINAVEEYITGIKTMWWPFCRKSHLRNSIQSILDDYQHPEVQALIERIKMLQKYQIDDKHQPANQPCSIFSQWEIHLLEKAELINKLQATLIKIRHEKNKLFRTRNRFYDHFQYLVKHPANECL